MKVSFDFDGVLTNREVQLYAKELVERGVEVWIISARRELQEGKWNYDMALVANKIGVSGDHIQFTNMQDKYLFLEGFVWHLDDDEVEIELIEENTDTIGILYTVLWKEACEAVLQNRMINEQ